jgi:hypothetical protein
MRDFRGRIGVKKSTVFIILGVLGGFLLFVGAIIAFVFYATGDIAGAADKFYATARDGDPNAVYALTSSELQKVTTSDQLAGYIKANRFDQVADTSWGSRSFENNLGNVEGTLTLDDGAKVPVAMELVNEAGGWKVSYIEIGQAGLRGGAGQ